MKLNHNCPICNKLIYLGEDTVNQQGMVYHLNCYLKNNSTEKQRVDILKEKLNELGFYKSLESLERLEKFMEEIK